MDVFAEIISLLRTKGELYGRLEFTAPWGMEFSGGKGICLMVTRGSCFLGVDQGPLIALAGGDFVFLSSPESYTLQSTPETPPRRAESVVSSEDFRKLRLIAHGGGGAPASLIAGCFTFATPESGMLMKHLPSILHVSGSNPRSGPWFQSTLQFIAAEIAQGLPGSSVIVDRLAEVLLVQAIRMQIHSPCRDADPSWLRALSDPQIGAAMQLMHAEPDRAWTVPELARNVSMSRSAFAAKFRALVGDPPLDHLTQWRMVRAASMMREDRTRTLDSVAAAVGYESESAFSKAFRRVIGLAPGKYRREHEDDAARMGLS